MGRGAPSSDNEAAAGQASAYELDKSEKQLKAWSAVRDELTHLEEFFAQGGDVLDYIFSRSISIPPVFELGGGMNRQPSRKSVESGPAGADPSSLSSATCGAPPRGEGALKDAPAMSLTTLKKVDGGKCEAGPGSVPLTVAGLTAPEPSHMEVTLRRDALAGAGEAGGAAEEGVQRSEEAATKKQPSEPTAPEGKLAASHLSAPTVGAGEVQRAEAPGAPREGSGLATEPVIHKSVPPVSSPHEKHASGPETTGDGAEPPPKGPAASQQGNGQSLDASKCEESGKASSEAARLPDSEAGEKPSERGPPGAPKTGGTGVAPSENPAHGSLVSRSTGAGTDPKEKRVERVTSGQGIETTVDAFLSKPSSVVRPPGGQTREAGPAPAGHAGVRVNLVLAGPSRLDGNGVGMVNVTSSSSRPLTGTPIPVEVRVPAEKSEGQQLQGLGAPPGSVSQAARLAGTSRGAPQEGAPGGGAYGTLTGASVQAGSRNSVRHGGGVGAASLAGAQKAGVVLPWEKDNDPSAHAEAERRKSEITAGARKAHEDCVIEEAELIIASRKQRAEGLRRPRGPEPARSKTHWDYVLEEMAWMANDFAQERLWKLAAAAQVSRWVSDEVLKNGKSALPALRQQRAVAKSIAELVAAFWQRRKSAVAGGEAQDASTGIAPRKEEAADKHPDTPVKEEPGPLETPSRAKAGTLEAVKDPTVSGGEGETAKAGSKGLEVAKYAERFLKDQERANLAEPPSTPDKRKEAQSLEPSWDDLAGEPLTLCVPVGAMEAYWMAVETPWAHFDSEHKRRALEHDAAGASLEPHLSPSELAMGEFAFALQGDRDARAAGDEEAGHGEKQADKGGDDEDSRMYAPFALGGDGGAARVSKRKRNVRDTQGMKQPRGLDSLLGREPEILIPSRSEEAGPPLRAAGEEAEAARDSHPGVVQGIIKRQRTQTPRVPRAPALVLPEIIRDPHPGPRPGMANERKPEHKDRNIGLREQIERRRGGNAGAEVGEPSSKAFDSSDDGSLVEGEGPVASGPPRPKRPRSFGEGRDEDSEEVELRERMGPLEKARRIGLPHRPKKVPGLGLGHPSSQPVGIPWLEVEDNALLASGPEYSFNWLLISDVIASQLRLQGIRRTPGQCRDRYTALIQMKRNGEKAEVGEDGQRRLHLPALHPHMRGSRLEQQLLKDESFKTHIDKIIELVELDRAARKAKKAKEASPVLISHPSHETAYKACSSSGVFPTPLELIDRGSPPGDASLQLPPPPVPPRHPP